ELTVAWALESPEGPPPKVVSADGKFSLPLSRVGSTPVYAAVETFPDGTGMLWHYEAGDRKLGGGPLEVYRVHPDSKEQPGVPKGEVRQMPPWESKIFAGTTRNWWVYVPAQYRPENPACVMVFQDGQNAKNYVPPVFDNLIAKGDLPVTVAICLSPGTRADGRTSNRSFEYDTLSD